MYITPIDAGYFVNSHFGISNHPIFIYYTSCSSYQNNLFNCNIKKFPFYYYYPQCNNYHEAAVKCERELMTNYM